MGFSIDNLTGLTLGQQGEHLVKTIRIDMSTWLDANADLQVYAVALRHGETTPYLAATTMDEQELVWPVSSIDTGIQGVGLVQIIGSNGTSIAKSKMIRTTVGTILPGSDEAEAPTLYQDTIDQLLADMTLIQNAAEDARDDAQAAKASMDALVGEKESIPLLLTAGQEAGVLNMDRRSQDFHPTLAVIGERLTRVEFYYNHNGKVFTFDEPGVSACVYDGFSGVTNEIDVMVTASKDQTATVFIATGMKADVVAAQAYSLICKDYADRLTEDS